MRAKFVRSLEKVNRLGGVVLGGGELFWESGMPFIGIELLSCSQTGGKWRGVRFRGARMLAPVVMYLK